MGFFQYGAVVEQVASTVAANGTTTLTNTSKQIQVLTASGSNGQNYQLPDATTMVNGMSFEFYNTSNGLSTIVNHAATALYSLSPGQSIIVKLTNNGTTSGTWVSLAASSSSTGGGSKNYLTTYTPSTSSDVANPGNGNFETGSTTGWSLAHSALSSFIPTSVATAGSVFSSSSGGSAAAGTLSLSVTSTNNISGLYSGSLASSGASTAGDMLVSNAFYIDKEDEAKMMQVKFYYNVNAGSTNLNFSGTSSNSFAVWIYDVTNGAWIMPQGVYNLVQNSGSGYCTATFQTTSNSTNYQLALININASGGAYTLIIDDFSVGPQTAPTGPAITDWTAYTPTFAGFGTTTGVSAYYRRVGDSVDIVVNFTAGTVTGSTASVSLPSGMTIDSNKAGSGNREYGKFYRSIATGSVAKQGVIKGVGGNSLLTFGYDDYTASVNPANDSTGSGTLNTSDSASLFAFNIPIVGWSSNTSMSSDTDTRVVAFSSNGSTTSISTSTTSTIVNPTTVFDTHGAYNNSTGTYTAPVSGDYIFYGGILSNAAITGVVNDAIILNFSKNGTPIYAARSVNQSTGSIRMNIADSSPPIQMNAGDTMVISLTNALGSTFTGAGSSTECYFGGNRLSGPAVIAATESVNARYYGATGTITSSNSAVTFPTKDFDSHNAYSGSTYTIPVSGKYQITARTIMDATFSLNATTNLSIYHNGTEVNHMFVYSPSTETGVPLIVSDILSCLAGDTIQIQAACSGASPTLGNTQPNSGFSIARVGN